MRQCPLENEMLINHSTWRPLISPLENWPLVLVDTRSVQPGDLETVDEVRTRSLSETYAVYPNSEHRFEALLLDMRDNEVILFKEYDTLKTFADGSPISQCTCCPFTSP